EWTPPNTGGQNGTGDTQNQNNGNQTNDLQAGQATNDPQTGQTINDQQAGQATNDQQGASDQPEATPTPVPVEYVTLDTAQANLFKHDKLNLVYSVYPDNAADKNVRFVSSNEEVAIVSVDGTVYAVGAGRATIECMPVSGGKSSHCVVDVTVPVTGVTVTTNRDTYKIGESAAVNVAINPADACDKNFELKVSGDSAILLENNVIYFVSGGNCAAIATASNGVTGRREITVVDLVEYANEVFRLTNIERQNAGIPVFGQREPLTAAAVVRAVECITYFSHDRPDGRDCFTAFDEAGASYWSAGENIAAGQLTPADVVRAWMNSPGHRENIMNAGFGNLGVGLAMDGSGRLYWAQAFTD
ncbi:MAG: Ig-like domain-containing protein, partial [Defluviitaleaceae bacterium]|nr:Ig-like domain-containing protein [Defluviitaleaceae bacterium]